MPDTTIDLVYLIDDDVVYQAITKRMIDIYAFAKRTVSFYDGLSAIRHLGQKLAEGIDLPDVILLDLNMPIMDGWDFLHAFQHLPKPAKKILIYIVTSSDLPSDMEMAAQFDTLEGYLVKPISEEDFASIWENFYMQRKLG